MYSIERPETSGQNQVNDSTAFRDRNRQVEVDSFKEKYPQFAGIIMQIVAVYTECMAINGKTPVISYEEKLLHILDCPRCCARIPEFLTLCGK